MELALVRKLDLSRWVRVGALVLLASFFVYRYLAYAHVIYLVLAGLLGAGALLATLGILAANLQGLAINVGVSLIFLDLVFYKLDLPTLWAALREANYWVFIPSTAMVAISLVIRAWRWAWLLRQTKRVGLGSLFSSMMIGIAANFVLPARAGEFMRAYFLGRRENLSKTTVFATVVVERLFDGLTILLFLLLVIAFGGVRSSQIQYWGYMGAVFYLGVIAGLLAVYFRRDGVVRLVDVVLPDVLAGKIIALLDAFLEGMHIVRDGRQLFMVVVLSLAAWVATALSIWPVMVAFDFGAPAPLFAPFFLLATLALGLTIPAAPGGIGIFQYVTLVTLRIAFSLSSASLASNFDEVAVAFSLILHFSQAAPEVLIGLYCFLRENVSLREVELEL